MILLTSETLSATLIGRSMGKESPGRPRKHPCKNCVVSPEHKEVYERLSAGHPNSEWAERAEPYGLLK